MKKTKEVSTLTEEQLNILNQAYPVSEDDNRLTLPRLGMLSKDLVETTGTGKNKKITILQTAGTFYTERDLGETNEEGKKVWTKEFIEGESIEGVICFHRKQLRKFDSSLQKFISSPIYDNADQIIPLYLDKQQIQKGTPAQLQALYPALTQKGKPTSDLQEHIILYVIYKGEMYQMNLSQSSKYEFLSYKKGLNPSTVVTKMSSIEDTFGTNTYRKMTFKKERVINGEEFNTVVENQKIIQDKVEADKRFYVPELKAGEDKELNEFDALPEGK